MTLFSSIPGILQQQGASAPSSLPASLSFDGTNHLISSVGLPSRTLRELTVTAWVNFAGATSRQGVVSFSDTSPLSDRIFFSESHPAVTFSVIGQFGDDAGTVQNWGALTPGSASLYGVWNFLAVRINSAGLGQYRYNAGTWTNFASFPNPYSVFNIVGSPEFRVGSSFSGTNIASAGTKIFQPTVSFRGLSDGDVDTIYSKDLSPADYSWDTTDAFDGTTLVCSDPTYNLTATGTGITADTGDVPA